MSEQVNHPEHYGGADNPYEVIKVLRAWYGENIPAWMLMLMKYTYRAGKKDPSKEIEDLEKARWYLDDQIAYLKRNQIPANSISTHAVIDDKIVTPSRKGRHGQG